MSLEEVRRVCLVCTFGFTAVHVSYMTSGSGESWKGPTGVPEDLREREEMVDISMGLLGLFGGGEGEWVRDMEEEGRVSGLAPSTSCLSCICLQLWGFVWALKGRDLAVSQVSRRCTWGVGTVKGSWGVEGAWAREVDRANGSWGGRCSWTTAKPSLSLWVSSNVRWSFWSWLGVYWWSMCRWWSSLAVSEQREEEGCIRRTHLYQP